MKIFFWGKKADKRALVSACGGTIVVADAAKVGDDSEEREVIDPSDFEDGGSPVFKSVVVVFAVLAIVWVVSALEPYVALISNSSGPCRTAAIGLSAVACLAVAIALLYILVQYVRLPRYVRYRRQDYVGREGRLVGKLRHYLQQGAKGDAEVVKARIGKSAYGKMMKLLDDTSASSEWLAGFVLYQRELDSWASKEVDRFAKRIGIMTSVVRSRRGDIVTVVFLSAAMILRLAKIYNQRMSGYSAFRLAFRFVMNVFIASQAQGVLGSMAKGLGAAAGAALAFVAAATGHPEIAVPVGGGVKVAADALGIGAEFAVNNLLAKKLGGFTRARLHVLVD